MSRVYWHALGATAELLGPERFHADHVTRSVFFGHLDGLHDETWSRPSLLRRLLPEGAYPLSVPVGDPKWRETAVTWMSFRMDARDCFALPGGRRVRPQDAILNTALVAGSPPVQLLARLHAQCEIHAYVEEAGRDALADVIDRGREVGILREHMGWEDVTALLRSGPPGRVFTSYSVGESFPNQATAKWLPSSWKGPADFWELPRSERVRLMDAHPEWTWGDEGEEEWEALGEAEQWRLAEAQVTRGDPPRDLSLRWDPADLSGRGVFKFGDGATAFDLNNAMREAVKA